MSTKLQTRRDWLAAQGLAKAGARGKFSNAAKAALAEADAKGMQFLDGASPTGPKTSVETKPTGNSGPAITKDKKPTGNSAGGQINSPYLFPSDFRYPEAEYVAVARDANGKRILHSMRECCNTCRVSLTNHGCESPSIHGNVTVKIERR